MFSRLQLALNVSDLEQSVAFYSKLFGVEPARRPGHRARTLSGHQLPQTGQLVEAVSNPAIRSSAAGTSR